MMQWLADGVSVCYLLGSEEKEIQEQVGQGVDLPRDAGHALEESPQRCTQPTVFLLLQGMLHVCRLGPDSRCRLEVAYASSSSNASVERV